MNQELRKQTAALCRNKGTRGFDGRFPSEWTPHKVINPECQLPFSDFSAWELIASELERGAEVVEISLDIPQGKTGYVLLIPLAHGERIYVKWMFGSGKVIGRSFHYG